MRLFHSLVFDDYVDGTTATYTAPEFNDLLGCAGTITLAGYTAKGTGTNPTLTVQVEQGVDGLRWTNRNALAEINAAAISTSAESTFQANDGNPVAAERERLVRLRIQLGGSSPRARVRLWATGRDAPTLPTPASISGLVLWLRGDMGITTVEAAVASANDLSTASWTPSNLSNRTATTITETNDGSPVTHRVLQTVPNLQLGHTTSLSIGVPASSGVGRYVGIVVDGGFIVGLIVDTQSGTFVNSPAGINNKQYANGVVTFDFTPSNSADIWLTTSDGTTTSYQGNGTRTATFSDVALIQRNVSAWADQSGNGNNFSIGTGADYPIYVPSLVASKPGITHDTTDRLSHASSVSFGTAASIFLVMQRGAVANTYITADSTSAHGLIENFTTNEVEWFISGGDRETLSTGATGFHIACITQTNGVNLTGYWDGTQAFSIVPSSALQNLKHIGFGAASNCGGSKAELLVYNRVLTTTERRTVEQYLSARYGITVP